MAEAEQRLHTHVTVLRGDNGSRGCCDCVDKSLRRHRRRRRVGPSRQRDIRGSGRPRAAEESARTDDPGRSSSRPWRRHAKTASTGADRRLGVPSTPVTDVGEKRPRRSEH